jgi:hypothetical protein
MKAKKQFIINRKTRRLFPVCPQNSLSSFLPWFVYLPVVGSDKGYPNLCAGVVCWVCFEWWMGSFVLAETFVGNLCCVYFWVGKLDFLVMVVSGVYACILGA